MIQRYKGLRIVDLPVNRCCKNTAAELIDFAAQYGVNRLISPCNSCLASLEQAGQGRIGIVSLPELLLKTMN